MLGLREICCPVIATEVSVLSLIFISQIKAYLGNTSGTVSSLRVNR